MLGEQLLECHVDNESYGSLEEAPDMLLSPTESDSLHSIEDYDASRISFHDVNQSDCISISVRLSLS